MIVSKAICRLSLHLSPLTCHPAYTPFTPSKSGQRLHPPYYRGCWHGVSRCLFPRYRRSRRNGHSSPGKELYTPKGFVTHAASLRQGFPHCAIFPTAASRRSLGRISVPVWLVVLSDQLPIVALVGRYPANKLIGRRLIPERPKALTRNTCVSRAECGIRPSFPGLFPTRGQITYVLLTSAPLY